MYLEKILLFQTPEMTEDGPGAKDDKGKRPVILDVSPSNDPRFFDLYPARRGEEVSITTWQWMWGHGKHEANINVCESNVIHNLEKMPMVKTLVGALEGIGCPVVLERHISCEVCPMGSYIQHAGGYDDVNNQVFICANNCNNSGYVHGALVRGLLQMFDRCAAKVDFKNVDHLACMEVRKANLASCNFMNYWSRTDANLAIKQEHSNCVFNTALESLIKTKFVDRDVAKEAVDRVFDKCYRDLEPVGRRIGKRSGMYLSKDERYLFGYS